MCREFRCPLSGYMSGAREGVDPIGHAQYRLAKLFCSQIGIIPLGHFRGSDVGQRARQHKFALRHCHEAYEAH